MWKIKKCTNDEIKFWWIRRHQINFMVCVPKSHLLGPRVYFYFSLHSYTKQQSLFPRGGSPYEISHTPTYLIVTDLQRKTEPSISASYKKELLSIDFAVCLLRMFCSFDEVKWSDSLVESDLNLTLRNCRISREKRKEKREMCQFSYWWKWRQEIKISRFFFNSGPAGGVDHNIYLVSPEV